MMFKCYHIPGWPFRTSEDMCKQNYSTLWLDLIRPSVTLDWSDYSLASHPLWQYWGNRLITARMMKRFGAATTSIRNEKPQSRESLIKIQIASPCIITDHGCSIFLILVSCVWHSFSTVKEKVVAVPPFGFSPHTTANIILAVTVRIKLPQQSSRVRQDSGHTHTHHQSRPHFRC